MEKDRVLSITENKTNEPELGKKSMKIISLLSFIYLNSQVNLQCLKYKYGDKR